MTRSLTLLCPTMVLVLLVGSLTGGCTERRRRARVQDEALVAKHVGREPTKPEHKLAIEFGDTVELIGYDLDGKAVERGKPFTITWHWKVNKPLGEGWKQFTHLLDGDGVSRVNLDENRKLFRALPAADWKSGQYVRDPQVVTIPSDWRSKGIELRIGFWRDDERMPIIEGPHDKEDRALAFKATVGTRLEPKKEKPGASTPTLVVRQREVEIKLDGALAESDWADAASTGPFVNTMTGEAGSFPVTAKALFDDEALYLAFDVKDDFLKSDFTKLDEHLWEQDTVELMVDPDGDGRNYFEMQVSPRGVVFDTRYDAPRDPRPFGHVDWNSELTSGVALRGKLDDDADDEGYTVEARIPWTAFAHGPTKASPPTAGTRFRANLFVMDRQEKGQRAVGWSAPLVGDFHTLARFGTLQFGEPPEVKPATTEGEKPKPVLPTASAPKPGGPVKPTGIVEPGQTKPTP